MDIANCTDVQLLAELINRNKLAQGPKKISFAEPHYETVVGIGSDNVAFIYLTEGDLEMLDALHAKQMYESQPNINPTEKMVEIVNSILPDNEKLAV